MYYKRKVEQPVLNILRAKDNQVVKKQQNISIMYGTLMHKGRP